MRMGGGRDRQMQVQLPLEPRSQVRTGAVGRTSHSFPSTFAEVDEMGARAGFQQIGLHARAHRTGYDVRQRAMQ